MSFEVTAAFEVAATSTIAADLIRSFTASGNITATSSSIGSATPALGTTIDLQWDGEACGVDWWRASNMVTVVAFVALNLSVIAGNGLVIVAVATSARLRSTTHLFIASLAVADLLVGVAVLPFSSALQLTGNWLFGALWCSVWLALDVWVCTASILNLCAISLDRYLAITRPVSYLTIMTTRRARTLCAAVWLLAFIIALPPLIARSESTVAVTSRGCVVTECALTSEKGYVVYSAVGSFFIPCFVMFFFYWRIYRAAVATTKSINQGFKTVGGNSSKSVKSSEFNSNLKNSENVTLRIHRGRPSQYNPTHLPARTTSERRVKSKSHSNLSSGESLRLKRTKTCHIPENPATLSPSINLLTPPSTHTGISTSASNPDTCVLTRQSPSSPSQARCAKHLPELEEQSALDKQSSKTVRSNLRAHAKRFRVETKAAKTLAIIIGVFVLCWLPFFSMYLVRPFCDGCISDRAFDIFFWLGYCNSAMNPILYACFSHDFRCAFKRILLLVFCCRRQRSMRSAVIALHNFYEGTRKAEAEI